MELYTTDNPEQYNLLKTPTQQITDETPQFTIDMLNTIYDWVKNPNNNAWGLTLPQI
jgi:hypothetical protein